MHSFQWRRLVAVTFVGTALLIAGVSCSVDRPPVITDGDPADAGGSDAGCQGDTSDRSNCGRCGNVCAGTQACIDGECQPSNACVVTGCPGAKTYCDTSTGVCRSGCAKDADCGVNRLCDGSTHSCVAAPANCFLTLCPPGHICDSTSSQCKGGCNAAGDCATGETCVSGACVASPPTCPQGTCPGGEWCDQLTSRCMAGCAQGAPCVNGGACDPSSHMCGARPAQATCVTDGCITGQYCDAVSGRCERGCAATGECRPGNYCDAQSHVCTALPTSCIPECPAGTHCSEGKCQTGCSGNAPCADGWVCQSGQCTMAPPDCTLTGCVAGEFCDVQSLRCRLGCPTTPCPRGQLCDEASALCVPTPTGCTSSSCTRGAKCDPGDGQCKKACGSGGTCPDGSTCDTNAQVCIADCSPGTCGPGSYCDSSGSCVQGCSVPVFPCPAGQACNNTTHTCADLPACASSCAPGTYCDATTGGVCTTGCNADAQCQNGQRCSLATHGCFTPDACAAMGEASCGNVCARLSSDPLNCGRCGSTCPPTAPNCGAGMCSNCPVGSVSCSGSCVTVQSDTQHCGNCSTVCPTGASCSAGVCQCPADQIVCGGACVDPESDDHNCGGCGTTCPSGQHCYSGVCGACPVAGQALCSGQCFDLSSNSQHCGSCTRSCGSGATCTAGQCVCSSSSTMCGSACINTSTDFNNCGACNHRCDAGQVCSSGNCRSCTSTSDCTARSPTGGVCLFGQCTPRCSRDSDCSDLGMSCYRMESQSTGICLDVCNTSSDCPGSAVCRLATTTTVGLAAGWVNYHFCMPGCASSGPNCSGDAIDGYGGSCSCSGGACWDGFNSECFVSTTSWAR